MLVETLLLFLSAATPQKALAALVAPASLLSFATASSYKADERAVDNWRLQSALALDMGPAAAARRALGAGDAEPARCVKLNNYWCIKRAGWSGEIAADADGHVAFATAHEGAAVAALLLRRYYVDYKLHTARAIVQRWAPAQCTPVIGLARPGPPASRARLARIPPQRIVSMGLAPRGIQNTLRARWLAAHGRGGVGGFGGGRGVGETADLMPTPSIMAGVAGAALPPATASPILAPIANCSAELARIANYATHLAEGVAASPNDDLRLFTAAGQPTGNLARAMANMAAVEIGPARPRASLIVAAIAQLRRMLEDPARLDPTPLATAP